MKKLWQVFRDVLFPPLCIHCESFLKDTKLLCQECLSHFILNSLTYNDGETIRSYLFEKPLPPWTLYREMKRGTLPFVSSIFTSYILIQIERLKWPSFHKVIYLPRRSLPRSILPRSTPLFSIVRELRHHLRKGKNKDNTILFLEEELSFTKMKAVTQKEGKEVYRLALFSTELSF